MTGPALRLLDDDGHEIVFDAAEAETFLDATDALEAATVSACPRCASRVLAAVAVVDLLGEAATHPRAGEIIDFADDAPTMHVYLVDSRAGCTHDSWRDPLFAEWLDVVEGPVPRPRA